MKGATLLIVEDEAIIAADLERQLSKLGYRVAGVAATGEDAIQQATALRPELVLMDIVLRGKLDGIESAACIRADLDVPVLYLTSHSDWRTLERALGSVPFGYVLKPFDARELFANIEMALYRHKLESKLRGAERWLAAAVHGIGEPVIATGRDTRIVLMNSAAETLTGWDFAAAKGKPLGEVLPLLDVESGVPVPDLAAAALAEGLTVGPEGGYRLRTRDGRELLVATSAAPVRDEDGVPDGAAILVRDASEAVHAAQRANQRVEEAERITFQTRNELVSLRERIDETSYAIAHNLRTPVRAIGGFANLLLKEHYRGEDPEAARMLERVHANAAAMGKMVDALVDWLQLGQHPVDPVDVDMNVAAKEALDALTPPSNARIALGRLPPARGDAELLGLVWRNLIANAIKYSARRDEPHIEISGAAESEVLSYRVRDNGAGFEPRYAGKLFKAFESLHAPGEFEGLGMGLAVARHIVAMHGGRIWAHGAPDAGATFCFTLPRRFGMQI